MEFGNAAWGFRELPLEEQLKITRGMGLGILELGIANAPGDLALSAGEAQIREVRNLYQSYGVRLRYGSTGNDFTTGDRTDLEKLKRGCELCHKLGIEYLRIFSGFSPVGEVTGERWDNMIACLKEADAYARTKGVYLVIETHGGVRSFADGVEHFMSTSSQPETLYRMLGELPDTVKVNFDPANLWAVGIQHPEEVYESCRERVAMVHLKDFAPLPSGHLRPAACGESRMDWKKILTALKDYEGAALFEYENPEDVAEGSRRCYEYIMEWMDA